MRIFIIVPAYNEENQINNTLSHIFNHYNNIIVVDDGSTDKTLEILKQYPNITILKHCINRGQGAALKTGSLYALANGADIIVHFDADGQHDIKDVFKAVEFLKKNNIDIVLGSRFLAKNNNVPILRKIALKTAILFTQFTTKIKLTDCHNGFRVMNRKAAQKINITHDGMAHASEIINEIIKNNLSYTEIPVNLKYTGYSISKGDSTINRSFKVIFELIFNKLK